MSTEIDDMSVEQNNSRKETRVLKYTETIDKLVVQNKQLQRELYDAQTKLDTLTEKLEENSIKISKNIFYIALIALAYFVYSVNMHMTNTQNQLVEVNVVLKEYKAEIEKTKLYNGILEKNLNVTPQTNNKN